MKIRRKNFTLNLELTKDNHIELWGMLPNDNLLMVYINHREINCLKKLINEYDKEIEKWSR